MSHKQAHNHENPLLSELLVRVREDAILLQSPAAVENVDRIEKYISRNQADLIHRGENGEDLVTFVTSLDLDKDGEVVTPQVGHKHYPHGKR